MSRVKVVIAIAAVLFVGSLVIRGFIASRGEAAREAGQEQLVKPPQRVSMQNGEPVIALNANEQREDGIETISLKNGPYQNQLRAYGTVLDLQPLTELANGYANAKARLETAQAKLADSRLAFERAQKLYKEQQNVSAAQLQAAEVAFRVDQASLAAAESQLRTLIVTAQQSWGAALGEAVVSATPLLMRLLARQDVLLQVTLRPGQAIALPLANASTLLDNGSHVPLEFLSAAPKTDPRIQGVSFFFAAPTASGLLPGMGVAAFLTTGQTVEGAEVPSSAIVWGEGRAWAYFRTGLQTFARRAVATDLPTPQGSYVVQGLPDHAEVVVQGAQMLFSEEYRAQIHVGG